MDKKLKTYQDSKFQMSDEVLGCVTCLECFYSDSIRTLQAFFVAYNSYNNSCYKRDIFSMCIKSFFYFSIGIIFIALVQLGVQLREWEVQ